MTHCTLVAREEKKLFLPNALVMDCSQMKKTRTYKMKGLGFFGTFFPTKCFLELQMSE